MKLAVCTLFEKSYHYGVAVLINSLYKNNFRGEVYVGYRGALPAWTGRSNPVAVEGWTNASALQLQDGLTIYLLPIESNWHLTNLKPTFIVAVLNGPAKEAAGIYYFDPDVTIVGSWNMYEYWISKGVAMTHEIVSNDMPATHPVRKGWIELIEKFELGPIREINSYINAGCCGVLQKHKGFLLLWKRVIEIGIEYHDFQVEALRSFPRPYLFTGSDQDAFNITAMCCKEPISEFGPEAMGFMYGEVLMTHATSHPKPWEKNFLRQTLDGRAPTMTDKAFWNNATGIIKAIPTSKVKLKRLVILVCIFIGRFYRRF